MALKIEAEGKYGSSNVWSKEGRIYAKDSNNVIIPIIVQVAFRSTVSLFKMASFNAITYNCNGLGNKAKRQKVFTFLRDKLKSGFVFLQEAHSVQNIEKEWNFVDF